MQRLRIFLLLLIFNLAVIYADQPVQTKTFVIPAGTQISVRNNQEIDSSKAGAGQTFAAQVTSDVRDAHGAVLIPHGSNAQVVIRSTSKGGKVKGTADLVVALHSVSVAGQRYTVNTTAVREEGSKGLGKNKRTGKYVGGGAAVGGIIGAMIRGPREPELIPGSRQRSSRAQPIPAIGEPDWRTPSVALVGSNVLFPIPAARMGMAWST